MAFEDSASEPINAEWYYVGHYGQLGPLTLEQMSELASDGVIDAETFVWRPSMADWQKASTIAELTKHVFPSGMPPAFGGTTVMPPPSPGTRAPQFNTPPTPGTPLSSPSTTPFGGQPFNTSQAQTQLRPFGGYGLYTAGAVVPQSDKSRVIAGVLNLIVPGVGRIYLGYFAHGALQLILCLCGLGFLWAWIDAILMFVGAVEYDGYGRKLN